MPFGAEYNAANESTQNRYKFTGKERDNESGLDYFVARHYTNGLGRFLSTDPLNILALQVRDPKRFQSVISAPSNWNQYSYSHNDPINKIDPDGRLTIVIAGTANNPTEWLKSPFLQQVQGTFKEKPIVLPWSADNSKAARSAAAKELRDLINNHQFAPGEKLNIVTHSHGGNVVFEANNSYNLNHKIDVLVTLGVPVRDDYVPRQDNIVLHINVYSFNDLIQPLGGHSWRGESGPAERIIWQPGVRNREAPMATGHTDLWTNYRVWQEVVLPELKK